MWIWVIGFISKNHPIRVWQRRNLTLCAHFFNEKSFLWLSLLIHQVTYSIAIHISSNCQLILHGNYVLMISGFLLLEDGLSSVNNNHLSKTSFLLNTGSCIQETKEYMKSPELWVFPKEYFIRYTNKVKDMDLLK